MRQHLEELDFSQRRDREPVLFVVHQNLLERKDMAGRSLTRLVDFTKSAFAQFLHHLVLANLAASLELALEGARRGSTRRSRHTGGGVNDT